MDSIAANLKPEYYKVKDFRLVSGEIIPELVVEYTTLGNPRLNSRGEVENAVLWCHGWSGSYIQGPSLYGKAFGPGRPLDPERYFIICTSALGSPGFLQPLHLGPRPTLPRYTIADMVQAQHLLLTLHLRVQHLKGVAGGSMATPNPPVGLRLPEFMDWAIPIATGPSSTGRVVGIWGSCPKPSSAIPPTVVDIIQNSLRTGCAEPSWAPISGISPPLLPTPIPKPRGCHERS